MVRISDILKNAKEQPKEQPKVTEVSEPRKTSSFPKPQMVIFPKLASSETGGPGNYVAQAIKGSGGAKEETAQKVYSRALNLAQTILNKAKTGEAITGKELQEVIDDIIRELTYENTELLNLACCQVVEEEKGEKFLSAKLVNKTILAVEIGVGKKMNKSKLFQLGVASFLSDLGITQAMDVVAKADILSKEDWDKIRTIPYKTVEILKKIPDLNQVVLTVARESHERADGTGPLGIKDIQRLDEFSRIVAVIDVFESLTHNRPHRKRTLPHEAVKIILEEGGKFEAEVLRLLIDRIGVYPVGSWVRLTNKEIAKVMASNPGQPLRPRVKIMFDEYGTLFENPELFDLSKNLLIQITRPVSDEDLKQLVKRD